MAVDITDDLVLHIARLSRLAISEREAVELKSHFEKVLAYVEAFQALDTSDVDPSSFALDAANVDREDGSRPSLPVADVLRNAPASNEHGFVVPRIVGDEDDEGAGPGGA